MRKNKKSILISLLYATITILISSLATLADSDSDSAIQASDNEESNSAVQSAVVEPAKQEAEPQDSAVAIIPSIAPSDDPDVAAELVEMKVNALPKVVESEKQKIHNNVVHIEDPKTIAPVNIEISEVKQPTNFVCHSGRTEYILDDSFDCGAGIAKNDNQATPMYTNKGKKYAYVELNIPRKDIPDHAALRIMHSAEHPTQQLFSVYYNENEVWRGACHNLKTTREGSVNECDLTVPARKQDNLRVRVEAYSREGVARWDVNNVQLVTDTITQPRIPDEATARNIPMPGGEIYAPVNLPPSSPQPATNPTNDPTTEVEFFDVGSDGLRASGPYTPLNSEITATPEPIAENQPIESDETAGNEIPQVVEAYADQPGFFRMTGAAIADLATRNPFGAFLTLLIIGLVSYMGYTFVKSRR